MRKLLAPVAAVALVLSMAGTALGWEEPTLTALCAPDANSYAWKITLAADEDDYNIDWSFDNFATFSTTDFLTDGEHEFITPRGGESLKVRWSSHPDSKAKADANGELCDPPDEEVEAGTGTPAATVSDSSMGVGPSSPLPQIIFSVLLVASLGTLAYTNVKVVRATHRVR